MDTNNKLEIFRRIYCLGGGDIAAAFKGNDIADHLMAKYESHRDKDGFHGNFSFLMDLDLENSKILLDYIGWVGDDLGAKGVA